MSNTASNYWKYYDDKNPLNVMVIGKTTCENEPYRVERDNSRIYAIEYMAKGRETLEINGKSYSPSENDAILLKKYSRHTYFAPKGERLEKVWVVFDGPLAESLIAAYLPEDEYCFPDCDLRPFFDEIFEIDRRYGGDYGTMTDALSVVLLKIFIHIKNRFSELDRDPALAIRQFLDANIEKALTMDDLCDRFNYSKNHLINLFSSKYGTTPYRYFTEKKMNVAKLYLANTRYPIGAIADLLAFSDQNYFSSEFKKRMGMSPSQYRKSLTERH